MVFQVWTHSWWAIYEELLWAYYEYDNSLSFFSPHHATWRVMSFSFLHERPVNVSSSAQLKVLLIDRRGSIKGKERRREERRGERQWWGCVCKVLHAAPEAPSLFQVWWHGHVRQQSPLPGMSVLFHGVGSSAVLFGRDSAVLGASRLRMPVPLPLA